MIHDLSEHTKRIFDWAAAGMAVLSITGVSAILTIVATLLTISWYGIRLYDRFRYGPHGE